MARAAAAALEAAAGRRRRRSSLDSAEPEFEFDDRGNVVSAEPVAQTESHRMIEHLMIAANEQVARLLGAARGCRRCTACTSGPTATAAERLIDQLASLGVPTPPVPKGHIYAAAGRRSDRRGVAAGRAVGRRRTAGGARRALTSLVLRSLKQAYYDQRNRGHAGLAARRATATSPRRSGATPT